MSRFSNSGFTKVPNILRGVDLDPYERVILEFMLQLNPCYPSLTTIATETRMCRRTVIRKIKSLEKRGLITTVRTHQRNNQYNVIAQLKKLSTTPLTLVTQSHQPSDSETPDLVTQSHPIKTNDQYKVLRKIEHECSWPEIGDLDKMRMIRESFVQDKSTNISVQR